MTPIGSAGLLRVAGMPIRYWLAGANPQLFSLARRVAEAQDRYRAQARLLAERIGRQVVPSSVLSRPDRAFVLAMRRKLHRGLPLSTGDSARLASVAGRVPPAGDRLRHQVERIGPCGAAVAAVEQRLTDGFAAEEVRLLRFCDDVLVESPVWHALTAEFDHGKPPQSAKRARQRAERTWRVLTRATTASTPRHWYGHVAQLVAGDGPDAFVVAVTDEFATYWMESIDTQRRALAASRPPLASPEIRLALTPLHLGENGWLRFVVVDPDVPDQAVELSLRHTDLLGAVRAPLRAGPRTLAELEAAVLRQLPAEEPAVLREFLAHLLAVGVLQACAVPRSRVSSWGSAATLARLAGSQPARDGWSDVYRRPSAHLPQPAYRHLQQLVTQAMRLLALISGDAHPPHPVPSAAGPSATKPSATGPSATEPSVAGQPRRLMDLLAQRLRTGDVGRPAWRRPPDWVAPVAAGSRFGRLHRHLAARLDTGPVIDVDPELLDQVGAPPPAIDWPVDCLLRLPAPGAPYAAVLDQVWPAGTVDARFVDALRLLDRRVPNVEAYRRFIDRLERETGMLVVELLIPPLSARAANAVRRPAYTTAWTGDADLATYRTPGGVPARYIPLDEITIRSTPDGPLAEVGGVRIWPVYHATRSPLPPWDHVAELLLATAPRVLPWTSRRLRHSANMFPERSAMPRITVAGELVVSAAQWRISVDELWDPGLAPAAKALAVVRLRERTGLPRWVFVAATPSERPVAVDLESLPGIRQIERLRHSADGSLVAAEMLPEPTSLLVADHAHRRGDRLVSELLLRLPCDEGPDEMAVRVSRRLVRSGRAPVPSRSRSPPRPAAPTRDIQEGSAADGHTANRARCVRRGHS